MQNRIIKFRVWDNEDCNYSGNWYALNCLQAMDKEIDYTRAKGRKIIEQYTGLKDKNGVEIYEGDIVKNTTTFHFADYIHKEPIDTVTEDTVIFDKHWCSYKFTSRTERGILEVIGNIYEDKKC